MNKLTYIGISVLIVFAVFWNCDSPTENDENLAVLSGQVVNAETLVPISNAAVIVLEFPQIAGFTDAAGFFNLEIEIDEAVEVQLRAFKESFVSDTISTLATPGNTVTNLALQLKPTSSTPLPSGSAASIVLMGVDPASIGVRESGAPEVSEISFQVQDSAGIPVDMSNSVRVNFLLGSSPGGGEFISPISAMTVSNGVAKTYLFSGDSSGVIQLIAEVTVGTQILRSRPVAITIHGGLPDSIHFSLAVEKLNFPGYNIYGLTDKVTAYVGDRYGNPVRPETAVYFTTDGGLIEGSALTNSQGQATVNLISASPKPFHPLLGAGFATVTARTADENNDQIEAYALVLFSGIPQISVSPTAINVPHTGSQTFFYTVSDQNNNPLAGGTSINVSVEKGEVEAVGNTNQTLPDTQSPSWTNFSFSLVDANPDSNKVNPVSVKISTSGPNGNLEYSLSGVAY
ncbi:MAG: hypothetical protein EH225_06955 [Calditrichaeota bacterium]|nr:Ig-like domain-containing protein [Calditrichota bacterium]RQV92989.1 MAG: hypothetical protein EH221_10475 [bacterium]RQW03542.1 MAG: hypothetical protein EH225_06955 [Calditrichota bacterium]